MSMQHLLEGLDPTGSSCLTTAQILQMIRAAQPFPFQGFIIWSDTAPDVVANPELAYFLWGKQIAGVKTKHIFYYTGSSWEEITLVDGADILDNSIPPDKISLADAEARDLLQVDNTGTVLLWQRPVDVYQNNELPVAKLLSPTDVNDYILEVHNGIKAWITLATFFSTTLPDQRIPIGKIIPAPASPNTKVPKTLPDGSTPFWSNLDITELVAGTASAGQAFKRNDDNTGWTTYTPLDPSSITGRIHWIPPIPVTGATVNGGYVTFTIPTTAVPKDAIGVLLLVEVYLDSSGGRNNNSTIVTTRAAGSEYVIGRWTAGSNSILYFSSQGASPVTAGMTNATLEYKIDNTNPAGTNTYSVSILGYNK